MNEVLTSPCTNHLCAIALSSEGIGSWTEWARGEIAKIKLCCRMAGIEFIHCPSTAAVALGLYGNQTDSVSSNTTEVIHVPLKSTFYFVCDRETLMMKVSIPGLNVGYTDFYERRDERKMFDQNGMISEIHYGPSSFLVGKGYIIPIGK